MLGRGRTARRQKHWQPGPRTKDLWQIQSQDLVRIAPATQSDKHVFSLASVSPLRWCAGCEEKTSHLNAKGGVREWREEKVEIVEEDCRKAEGNRDLHFLGKMLIDLRGRQGQNSLKCRGPSV